MEINTIDQLLRLYSEIRSDIETRLDEFAQVGKRADDEELFAELAFCLFTPQSSANRCWESVCRLRDKDLLNCFTPDEQLYPHMTGVRFHITKTKRLRTARALFFGEGAYPLSELLRDKCPKPAREWLVGQVKGLSYKEASHFLRNVGYGGNLAIIDRHILRAMMEFGLIDAVPTTVNPARYLELESRLIAFGSKIGVPPDHLDLLLWYRTKSEIFK